MTATPEASMLTRVSRLTSIGETLQIVERDGGVIIESLLTSEVVEAFNSDIDHVIAELHPGTEHTDIPPDHHGANTKRLCNLITISPTFRERIITDDVILGIANEVMTRLSDSFWMNTAQLIEIGPQSALQPLHRDLGNYPYFASAGPSGPEVMCNFLIAMTDFTEENGATRVIPGSNRWERFSDLDQEKCQLMTIPAVMKAGDALFMSGKVVHGGGANVTTDEYRRGVALPFNPGFLVPEEAYPFLVPLELARSLPPNVQQLIGFRSFHNRSNHGGSLWQDNYSELATTLGL